MGESPDPLGRGLYQLPSNEKLKDREPSSDLTLSSFQLSRVAMGVQNLSDAQACIFWYMGNWFVVGWGLFCFSVELKLVYNAVREALLRFDRVCGRDRGLHRVSFGVSDLKARFVSVKYVYLKTRLQGWRETCCRLVRVSDLGCDLPLDDIPMIIVRRNLLAYEPAHSYLAAKDFTSDAAKALGKDCHKWKSIMDGRISFFRPSTSNSILKFTHSTIALCSACSRCIFHCVRYTVPVSSGRDRREEAC